MEIAEKGYLFCITGLPGSGKSTTADILTQHLIKRGIQSAHYTTDGIRDRLYPNLPDEARFGEWKPGELDMVYNCLSMLIDELFKYSPRSFSVITDGTFRFEAQRSRLREVALGSNRQLKLIKVNADEEIVIPRAELRLRQKQGAGAVNYHSAKGEYEEPSEAFQIDNNGDLNHLDSQIQSFVSNLH
jgi:predicted kinase